MTWGNQFRGGMGQMGRGRGQMGSMGGIPGQTGFGNQQWTWPGGVQQRDPSWTEKLAPWASVFGGVADSLWGAEAQEAKRRRELQEWEIARQEAQDASDKKRNTNIWNAMAQKWPQGG